MNLLIARLVGVITAATVIQVFTSSTAVAAPIIGGEVPQSLSAKADQIKIATDLQQFVPPDTGGPDQTGSTGTR